MNKSELVEVLAAKNHMTVTDSERFINSLTRTIYDHLRDGKGKVQISGFGTFSVSHRAPRLGVNPRKPTEKIEIPKLRTPKFKAGESFKEAVKL